MKKTRVDIVVPAYNEAPHLAKNIELVYKTLKRIKPSFDWQILIGENGSKDNTYEVAKQLAKKYGEVKAYHFPIGSKDNTVKSLWLNSNADILIFTDADNSADPKFIPDLVKAITDGFDIAAGDRFHSKANSRGLYREMLSRIYNNLLLPLILPTGVKDTQCGFKAINKKVVKSIVPKLGKENGFFDTELLAIAKHKGFTVKAVPITWKETRRSVLSVNKNIPNFLKNVVKTRYRLFKGQYD
jgi:glycosyltransferase involved in cell wall biosynthesis